MFAIMNLKINLRQFITECYFNLLIHLQAIKIFFQLPRSLVILLIVFFFHLRVCLKITFVLNVRKDFQSLRFYCDIKRCTTVEPDRDRYLMPYLFVYSIASDNSLKYYFRSLFSWLFLWFSLFILLVCAKKSEK